MIIIMKKTFIFFFLFSIFFLNSLDLYAFNTNESQLTFVSYSTHLHSTNGWNNTENVFSLDIDLVDTPLFDSVNYELELTAIESVIKTIKFGIYNSLGTFYTAGAYDTELIFTFSHSPIQQIVSVNVDFYYNATIYNYTLSNTYSIDDYPNIRLSINQNDYYIGFALGDNYDEVSTTSFLNRFEYSDDDDTINNFGIKILDINNTAVHDSFRTTTSDTYGVSPDLMTKIALFYYTKGYDVGENAGYSNALNGLNGGSWLLGFTAGVIDILSLEVVPNFPLALFVFIPLFFGLINFVFRLGGRRV